MSAIRGLIKNTEKKVKILVFLVCAYIGVLASFQDVGAVTELVGYEPAISVQVKDGANEVMNYLVKRNNVTNVLNDLEIVLGQEDTLNMALTDQVSEGSLIEITRVTYEEERVPTSIPYTTNYIDSDDPTLFGTRLVKAGETGTKDVIFKKKMVNGKEVERTEVGSEVVKEAVAAVVEQGTVSSGVTFTGRLTRYGADCAGCGTRTAAGLYVTTNGVKDEGKATLSYAGGEYYVLAADRSIPFGSIIKVSNHGYSIPDPFYGIVLDRGGAVTGTSVDVFCGSERAGFFTGGTTYNTQFEIVSMGSGQTGIY